MQDASGPRRHHDHAVAEHERLAHVVRDEDHRLAVSHPDPLQQQVHVAARLRVERSERLVHEQHGGVDRERPRELDAHAHAAGELVRERVLEPVEVDERDVLPRARVGVRAREAARAEREHEVLRAR